MEENQNTVPQEEVVENKTSVGAVPESAPDDFKEPKKKGKILPIVIIVLVVLIAAVVGGFFYFKSQRTATKYIDTKVKEVRNNIEDAFSNKIVANASKINFLEDDFTIDGKVKITSSGDMLGALDGTELATNIKVSPKKEYIETKIDAKDKNTSINGTVAIDGKKIYFDVKDVLSNPVYALTEENVFDLAKESVNNVDLDQFKDLLDVSKIKDISLKTIDFIGTAFKETATSTKQKGLNVEYVYEFNKDTITKALNKLVELAKNDKSYAELIKSFTEMDITKLEIPELDFNNKAVVKIEVGLFDNKLKDLSVTFDDKAIISKTEKDKYKFAYDLEDSSNYAILTIKDDEFGAIIYQENKEVGLFNIVSKKNDATITFKVTSAGISGTINIKEVSKNETKMSIDANVIIVNAKANITVKENNNKFEVSGNIDVNIPSIMGSQAQSIKVEFSGSAGYGKDIFNKADFSNAKNVDTLTSAENEQFSKALEEKLTKFGALNFLESMFGGLIDSENYENEFEPTEVFDVEVVDDEDEI